MKTWIVEIRVKDWIVTDTPILEYVEVEINDNADEYTARHVGFNEYALMVTYQPKVRKHVVDVCKTNFLDTQSYAKYFCAADAVLLD